MNLNDKLINSLLEKYKKVGNQLSEKYHYPKNMTHLLYLIVPALIIKYGMQNEKWILNCLEETEIKITNKEDQVYQASYYCIPKKEQHEISTFRGIQLNRYENISLMQLLENLTHEMNHAMNSYKNSIRENQEQIEVRCGLMFFYYQKSTLSFLKKSDTVLLEEVINTRQSEELVDLIHSFYNYQLEDEEIKNTLYSIHHNISNRFKSNAYSLQTTLMRPLLENKTFMSTLEKLRLNGEVEEIETWFDKITFEKGSYQKLSRILEELFILQTKMTSKSLFQSFKVSRIKKRFEEGSRIVSLFDQNCNYR